jgi:hypothetical protein
LYQVCRVDRVAGELRPVAAVEQVEQIDRDQFG